MREHKLNSQQEGVDKLRRWLLMGCLIAIFSFGSVAAAPSEVDCEKAIKRLRSLEPETPVDIIDWLAATPLPPSKVVPPQTVMKSGSSLKYRMLFDKPDWKRPVYKSYWHSTFWRWSYVPRRLYYAQHRLFTSSPAAASVSYDFIHDIGLADELKNISSEEKGQSQEERLARRMIVVMQARIEKVLTKGTQVVIIARPQRTGLQVFTINTLNMRKDNPNEAILYQLVTPDGDEIDYVVQS